MRPLGTSLAGRIANGIPKQVRDKTNLSNLDLSLAIEDLGYRTIIDSCDLKPIRITKGGGIGVFNFGNVCAKRHVIALIERNRPNDFARNSLSHPITLW